MIAACHRSQSPESLVVFSDDWGRHPSSCQHLVRQLLSRYPVLWVNTIGTRAPRLDRQTFNRVAGKIAKMTSSRCSGVRPASDDRITEKSCSVERSGDRPALMSSSVYKADSNPAVVNPLMWPWLDTDRNRRLNRWLLTKQLIPQIEKLPRPVVAVTTLPVTADLPEVLPVDRWVYYCVDDFSQWPGLDGKTLRTMDIAMIRRADSLVAVSEMLQAMIAAEGRTSSLLTHGVDIDFWKSAASSSCLDQFPHAKIVFWGVIDRRLDAAMLRQLSTDLKNGSILLIGPQQNPDPTLLSLPHLHVLPAQPLEALPGIAAAADVLIMPYADLPVTRAMQPLKLKEYLATGKPVIVSQLPATDSWRDCLDVASSPEDFSLLVQQRIAAGVPGTQTMARQRLTQERWLHKAEQFEQILCGVCQTNERWAKPAASKLLKPAPCISTQEATDSSGVSRCLIGQDPDRFYIGLQS